MKKLILLVFICLLSSCANSHFTPSIESLTSTVFEQKDSPQFSTITLNTHINALWTSPYASQDITVDLEIITPNNKRLFLPGYHVNGQSNELSLWRFKFTPIEVGTYLVAARITNQGQTTTSKKQQFTTVKSSKKGFLRAKDNWTFQYDNGELFRGLGENFAWESRDNDDSQFFKALHENKRFNYEDMLASLSQSGANIFRTWMIFWNLPVDYQIVDNNARYQSSTSRFNPSAIKRMDELIELSAKFSMSIILSMDSHAGFAGDGWNFNSYNQKNGGPAKSSADFFVNQAAKQRYKDKLRFLVARWSYSPQIAAWEFFNEIDNVMYDGEDQHIADEVITAWHKEMSDYLASIDVHNHLTTTSISHRNVNGLFNLANIDINQTHLYKVTDKIPSIIREQTEKYQSPYFVGEFSAEWDWSKNFDLIKSTMVDDYKKGLWYGMFSPSPIMPLSWWWEYFDENGTANYFDHVKTINDLMLSSAKSQLIDQKVFNSNSELTTLALNNGEKAFVYVQNTTNNSKKFKLTGLAMYNKIESIYDCDTGKFFSSDVMNNFIIKAKSHWVIIYSL